MFAFLIWDAQERVLFGARDWFGIKPLYTLPRRARLLLRQREEVAAGRRRPDVGRRRRRTPPLQHYLTLQYVPEPASMHSRIRRIESGTYFTLRPGEPLQSARYFHPDFAIRAGRREPDKLYREITEVLEDSVAKHMRADVTVGSFLSGGIDSTAIAALAKRHNPKLLTFTTGFEREGSREIDVAAESAAAIGVEHITKVVTAAGDDGYAAADRLVPRRPGRRPGPGAAVLHRPGGPQARQGRAVRRGCRRAVRRLQIYREADSLRAFDYIPPVVRRGLGAVSERSAEGMRGKDLLRRGSIGIEERYYGNARIFRPDEMTEVVRQFDPATSYLDVTNRSARRRRRRLRLASTFAEPALDVRVAKVATLGQRVVDVFYVRDAGGRKLEPDLAEAVRATRHASLARVLPAWQMRTGPPTRTAAAAAARQSFLYTHRSYRAAGSSTRPTLSR